jgi:cytochrome P450
MDKPDLETLTFLDPEVQECPFPAYAVLHDQAPVFYDRRAGFYVVSGYEDIRRIVTDPATFSSGATVELARDSVDPRRAEAARRLFEEKGWLPTPTLSLQDDPRHKEVRALFQKALRAGKIRELDPFIHQTAIDLVDDFIGDGRCELVSQYTVPLPLIAICSQVGVRIDDIWAIKRWTDAWMRRFSMMLSEEEELACVEAEIEFQHYFADIVEDLKARPNDSILSDLVNTQLSDGSRLGYDDIVSHLMSDVFVGGSETTTNAMSEGVLMLCRNPDQYALLQSDLDRHLPGFIEETLRLQSPVQGLYRVTTREVELRGVTIPARSLVHLRFGAANRDGGQFACPADLDVTRQNAGAHLAFGSGIHHCIGAPLARRELLWGFKVLLDRCRNIRLAPEGNDFTHVPGMNLRALKALHVEFDPA